MPEPALTSPATDSAVLTRRAAQGAFALGIRQVAVQGLNLAGGILLARFLSPGEFGIYAVILFLLAFLIAFGDVGLGASLIRQVQEPTLEDYRAIFTVQQIFVFAAVAGFWLASPWIAEAYDRPPGDAWVFRILALSLVLTSLQTVAAIRLERHLAFEKLAVVEVAQALVFNGLAVGLAWNGFGAMSFALALLARSAVGAVLTNLISPWPVGWRWDWERVRAHLRFGLPYQGISFVSLLKDSITPVLIGLLLGAREVGYVNWAGMVAVYPVLALMVLQRVYLPAFSRMQAHPQELRRFIETVLRATNTLVAPLAVLTLVLIEPATRVIFGEKWLPALPYFYLLWVGNLFVPTATPLMGLLNALGYSSVAFRFAVVWMLGTWLIGAPLILLFGAIGFAVANVLVQFSNLLLYRAAQSRSSFRVLGPTLPAWGAAAAAGSVVFLLARSAPPDGLLGLASHALVGVLLYLGFLVVLDREGAARAWSWFRSDAWRLASR